MGNDRGLPCIYKDANHPITPEDHRRSCQNTVEHTDHNHLPDALVDPVDPAGTEVLAAEGRARIGKCVIWRHRKLFNLRTGCECCDDGRAKRVDRALQNDTADRSDRKLQSHRDTHAEQNLHPVSRKLFLLPVQLQDRKTLFHINDTADAGNGLCNDRGDGCALYAHPKDQNAHQITNNIDDGRYGKEQKRALAVSERTQNTSSQIIKNRKRNPDKDNDQVPVRAV